MVFNSYLFVLFFLPAAVIGYFVLNKFKQYNIAKLFLIAMSFWFYGFNNPDYLPIIISSILVNFGLSSILLKTSKKFLSRIFLIIGILFNLGILGYFKYYDFFIENINSLLGTDYNLLKIMLPLGISFFTFQQLSYIIDSYKKTVPKYNILDYSLFVTFFPQLVAGPIVLHSEIVPQFADKTKKKLNYENLYKGIFAFARGLAKKVLLADILGIIVNTGFSDIGDLGTTNAIIVMLSYTFQIYFDFSGYCDMATGIGLMFNINIPMNFNSPYKSTTIAEFWKRWHMTLTRFFTTYVYIPLGGNKKGAVRTYVNIFIVFVVSGFWHGANWTFIVWGIAHGVAMLINKLFKKGIDKINPVLNWIMTFAFVNLTWVIFRAESLKDVSAFFKELISLDFTPISSKFFDALRPAEIDYALTNLEPLTQYIGNIWFVGFFAVALVAVLQMRNLNERILTLKPRLFSTVTTAVLLLWSVVSFSGVSTFIYFNF